MVQAEYKEYCATVGHDPLHIQGAGGNASWKEGDTLWVKASGKWLADATKEEIFLPIDLAELTSHIETGNFEIKPVILKKTELRPSIETILHAVMPQKYVLHTHPVQALAYLVTKEGKADIATRLGDKVAWTYVPYRKPGPDLGKAIYKAIHQQPQKNITVVFLENHGVVISANKLDKLIALNEFLTKELSRDISADLLNARSIQENKHNFSGYHLLDNPIAMAFVHDEKRIEIAKKYWALYPDHVVFLGEKARLFLNQDDCKKAFEHEGNLGDYAIVENYGLLIKDKLPQNKIDMLICYISVCVRLDLSKHISPLSIENIGELLNWDAEKYRSSISK
ncbi:aldolase [Terasakiella brassicae]|uniref:Aldolase n=1 Tax=Terasakiella brassicae TaxID=1634917 RepID=A0A917FD33_9PROT|nr:class II aldolase/adducin family protein [Terasakiella brassicae]GGF66604.1 aldolase [Terasakiella brassicae]